MSGWVKLTASVRNEARSHFRDLGLSYADVSVDDVRLLWSVLDVGLRMQRYAFPASAVGLQAEWHMAAGGPVIYEADLEGAGMRSARLRLQAGDEVLEAVTFREGKGVRVTEADTLDDATFGAMKTVATFTNPITSPSLTLVSTDGTVWARNRQWCLMLTDGGRTLKFGPLRGTQILVR